MPKRTAKEMNLVLAFARACYKEDLQTLLDDPHGFAGTEDEGWTGERGYLYHTVETWRLLGKALDIDFDATIRQLGTALEVQRLLKLVHESRQEELVAGIIEEAGGSITLDEWLDPSGEVRKRLG